MGAQVGATARPSTARIPSLRAGPALIRMPAQQVTGFMHPAGSTRRKLVPVAPMVAPTPMMPVAPAPMMPVCVLDVGVVHGLFGRWRGKCERGRRAGRSGDKHRPANKGGDRATGQNAQHHAYPPACRGACYYKRAKFQTPRRRSCSQGKGRPDAAAPDIRAHRARQLIAEHPDTHPVVCARRRPSAAQQGQVGPPGPWSPAGAAPSACCSPSRRRSAAPGCRSPSRRDRRGG
jgi:hypothetical protein